MAGPRADTPSQLKRRVTWLGRLGVAVQLQLAIIVLASGLAIAQDTHRALAIRATEVAAANLLANMADQQTGLLTYFQLAQPDSLVLYGAGRAGVAIDLEQLESDAAGTAQARLVATVATGVGGWEGWAEGLHAQQQPITDAVVILEGRHLFAAFVVALDRLSVSLDQEWQRASDRIRLSTLVAIGVVAADSVAVATVIGLFSAQVARRVLRPLRGLAAAARRVTDEGFAAIPHRGRDDEVGALARALQGWQEAASVRTFVTEHAPVGICRIDAAGRLLLGNTALGNVLGCPRSELVGRELASLLHPDDLPRVSRALRLTVGGHAARSQVESRWLRGDGSVVWCSMALTPVHDAAGGRPTLVGVIEDITERKRQSERTAEVQRDLLPDRRPQLDGYDLAAACRPMQDVTGDFYDWTGPQDGQLDLTVADVMGGGPGAALLMATLRMTLRTMPRDLGPGARTGLFAESMGSVFAQDGPTVALFHARLDLATGALRYVDASDGRCAIVRAGGDVARLPACSGPLGASAGDRPAEGRAELEPGDTLIAFTDGLVELAGRTVPLEELASTLAEGGSAEDAVARLVRRTRDRQRDDATVVLLRRARTGPPAPSV